jgi:hypothetical protein
MERIIIAGGSGFLGRTLIQRLQRDAADIVVLSRSARPTPGARVVTWDARTLSDEVLREVEGASAIINLTGANVGESRWTQHRKREIMESRVLSTRVLVEAIRRVAQPPVLVNASGVGYFGNTTTPVDDDAPSGSDFLARVCAAWEAEARTAEPYTRVVITRLGVVLDRSEGILKKLVPVFQLGIGGVLGSGDQHLPWVHASDAADTLLHVARTPSCRGAYTVATQPPPTMREFVTTLARVLHRPKLLPVPSFALRALLGEQADMVLMGQNACSRRLEESGFRFRFTSLDEAIFVVLHPTQSHEITTAEQRSHEH